MTLLDYWCNNVVLVLVNEKIVIFTQKHKKNEVIILYVVQKCICLLQVSDQYSIKRKGKVFCKTK